MMIIPLIVWKAKGFIPMSISSQALYREGSEASGNTYTISVVEKRETLKGLRYGPILRETVSSLIDGVKCSDFMRRFDMYSGELSEVLRNALQPMLRFVQHCDADDFTDKGEV